MVDLRSYQKQALGQMLEQRRVIYADDPGTGKTPTTLRWLRDSGVHRSLIVAPPNVIHHWEQQASVWHPALNVVDCRGPLKKRLDKYEMVAHHPGISRDPVAVIINYELVRQDTAYLTILADQCFDAIVFDEAHHLKNRQAQVFKAAQKLCRRVDHLALVTGTPVLNRGEEAWSLLNLLLPRTYKSFHRWVGEHYEVKLTTFHGKLPRPIPLVGDPKEGHEELIAAELGAHLIRRPIEDLLPDMPDVTETVLEIDLSPDERRVYNSMAKKLWTDMGGVIVKAKNEAVMHGRCRQLVSDWNGVEDMGKPGSKVKACADLIESLGDEQVVVLVSYKETAYQLWDLLTAGGVAAANVIQGDISARDRVLFLKRFQEGKTRVLIGTHATLGTGVDGLQVARNIVLLDQDWTPAKNEQAVARIRRSGQTADKVNVYKIVALNTIDQVVQAALERKQSVIDAIVGQTVSDVLTGRLAA